ncbi:short-chain dehydrogenase/reductase (plasmid) [Fulvitalea axinellae]|uniref:Short-chain dehydrogenase/reductase n=1 Tax=Fulvitalea axinellae TaxID=1182444 RepID=A0AAU9CQ64_9BACT|nr:short-chain dehydrogenase/reductase [Fulvitalea axinellae]
MSKTVIITGASTGFGKVTAKKFQAEGWNVVATMRSPEKETELNQLDNVLVCKMDVTEEASVHQALALATEKFGSVDALVNNAGYGALGVLEGASEEAVRRQFEVNVFGLIKVTQATIPIMREQGSGVIVNISSVGGRLAFPYFSLYHSSKFAVEGLTESLQYELNPLGIKMKIVEPGAYKTDFATRSLDIYGKGPEAYHQAFDEFMAFMSNLNSSQNISEVADAIFKASTDDSDQLRYVVGADAEQYIETAKELGTEGFIKMIRDRMKG